MGLLLLSSAAPAANPSPVTPVDPPEGGAFSVTLTGYNAVPAQTKPDPSTTANGGPSNPEVVAARSRDLADKLPFGTIIEITRTATDTASCGFSTVEPLIGYRVITDTMSGRIHNTIDVLFGVHEPIKLADRTVNASVALGNCDATSIRVVGSLDLTHVDDLPKTQADLAAIVNHSGLPAQASLALAK